MKKLLLIALLIVGCENSTEPEVESADCAGVIGGSATVDCLTNECTTVAENIELWNVCYNIVDTDTISLSGYYDIELGGVIYGELVGEIPSEIGNLTNLVTLLLGGNQLTGEIPPEVCDLIESKSRLFMHNILTGNNLTNNCE